MAYPATRFQLIDNSDINPVEVPEKDDTDRPVYFCVFSSDKGPEDYQNTIMGQDFYDLYGTPSFAKHGQPLIQASAAINAGARLFSKRIVAEDSKLANTLIMAIVDTKDDEPVIDKTTGDAYYIDTSGRYTTNASDADITLPNGGLLTQKKLAVDIIAVNTDCPNNSLTQLATKCKGYTVHTANGEHGEYPLFLITDNGRGVSNKKFKIAVDTSASHPVDWVKYIITTFEDDPTAVSNEQIGFTMNPDVISNQTNLSLSMSVSQQSKQIRAAIFENEFAEFIDNCMYTGNLASTTNPYVLDGGAAVAKDPIDYKNCDILFNSDLWGNTMDDYIAFNTGAAVEKSGYAKNQMVNLSQIQGIALEGGDNGSFGDCPIQSAMYDSEVIKAFTGNNDPGDVTEPDQVYDLDNVRIDAIFDANFNPAVKRKIEEFVEFREDCFYFRDMGLGLDSYDKIKHADEQNLHSRLCATYENSWDIIEPYTKKQITVTCMYNLCQLFVGHFINGRHRPFMGQLYGITFPDVIRGTVNFTPKNTPKEDQKQEIDDLRINYAGYYQGLLTMETDYTSQNRYTQLSWLHNVLLIQELIKAIRARCPKIRYNFMDEDSLKKYEEDVQAVIDKFVSKFESITMEYVEDSVYKANKIFYAVISVQLKDFIQSELFKITVLRNS